jgi:hypothetical protein
LRHFGHDDAGPTPDAPTNAQTKKFGGWPLTTQLGRSLQLSRTIAMTMADIPLTDGAPDQGTEGIRFLGYTVYDPLVRWDLSRADSPAKLVPGLATRCERKGAPRLDPYGHEHL